jgi:hypothetical protein
MFSSLAYCAAALRLSRAHHRTTLNNVARKTRASYSPSGRFQAPRLLSTTLKAGQQAWPPPGSSAPDGWRDCLRELWRAPGLSVRRGRAAQKKSLGRKNALAFRLGSVSFLGGFFMARRAAGGHPAQKTALYGRQILGYRSAPPGSGKSCTLGFVSTSTLENIACNNAGNLDSTFTANRDSVAVAKRVSMREKKTKIRDTSGIYGLIRSAKSQL